GGKKETASTYRNFHGSSGTLMAWVKTSADPTVSHVVGMVDSGTKKFVFYKISNKYSFRLNVGGSNRISALIPEDLVQTGEWVHLTGVYDGANIKIYLNGVQYGD